MEGEVEELCKLGKIPPEILEVALKELWQRKPALYKSVIINAYLDEKITGEDSRECQTRCKNQRL